MTLRIAVKLREEKQSSLSNGNTVSYSHVCCVISKETGINQEA